MTHFIFRCRDIGNNCEFSVKARNAEDLVPKIRDHIISHHNVPTISEELKDKINSSIKMRPL
ncbi:MAG TPA: DUF1059 domain-containing protein [Thermoplasmataceae archaeon]|nr:DUF1059 domain-containing protein [Thermoplasmataceae archaeon]